MKTVVYTAVVGGRNILLPPAVVGPNVEYVAFTDTPRHCPPWECRPLAYHLNDPRRTAREHKLRAHELFPKYEASIWVDGRIVLHCLPSFLTDAFLKKHHIAVSAHGDRDCAYKEAIFCRDKRYDDPITIMEQIRRYRQQGYPDHYGLCETGVLVRRHCVETKQFNELWKHEVNNGSCRDQISVNYCLWNLNLPWTKLSNNLRKTSFWKLLRHSRNSTREEQWLEVGPGEHPITKGTYSINIKPQNGVTHVAKWGKDVFPFTDNTFDYAYASHVLEHVHWTRTDRALKEILRVLKPGKRFECWVPDFNKIVEAWQRGETLDGRDRYSNPDVWLNWRVFTHEMDAHRACFSPEYLVKCFEQAGFVDVRLLEQPSWPTIHQTINLGIVGAKP